MQSFIHKNLVEKAELNTHIKLGFSIPVLSRHGIHDLYKKRPLLFISV